MFIRKAGWVAENKAPANNNTQEIKGEKDKKGVGLVYKKTRFRSQRKWRASK